MLWTADTIRGLVKEYGLQEHAVREGNVNRFMAFIGKYAYLSGVRWQTAHSSLVGVTFQLILPITKK